MMNSELLSIENYVPHRGVMLLLDRLLSADEDSALAEVTVLRDGVFAHDAGMPSWVGMEYMAQTVAAWAGWNAIRKGEAVKIGFLLGSRKYEAVQPFFAPGARLRVSVACDLMGDNGLGMFDCRIHDVHGKEVASARISVFEPAEGRASIAPSPLVSH